MDQITSETETLHEWKNPLERLSEIRSKSSNELISEIETRLKLNPDFSRRIESDLGGMGFIELEDSWGWEGTILNTARISASNKRIHKGDKLSDADKTLLYHLMKANHGTPFERVYFHFRVICPQFVMKQWLRHRMSSFNEYSMRYRTGIHSFYVPGPKARSVNGFEVMNEEEISEYCDLLEKNYKFYADMYEKVLKRLEQAEKDGKIPALGSMGGRNPYRGRVRELLRNVMPMASYTDMYWTVNFRSLRNFMALRCGKPVNEEEDAQFEIREYADTIFQLFTKKFPVLSDVMLKILAEKNTAS
ncbi:MAG: thymidylate synthase [Bacteriovoracaceae bacterium]|nr:thymidylate synthase [Bacteriovoracaceae bacterium]